MKLKREFVFVHQNQGLFDREENTLRAELVGEIMNLNDHPHCTATEYEGTITITCQSVGGLAALASLCIGDTECPDCPDLRFRMTLQSNLVKFIG